MKKEIQCKHAAPPCSHYSQAVLSTGTSRLYMSSLGPYVQEGELPTDIKGQTTILFDNINHLLTENGFTFLDIVKVNVYLKNQEDFPVFNNVYKAHLSKPWPARSAFVDNQLDALLEINLIAEK